MSINLSINNETYKYDVFQIVKIFFPYKDVKYSDASVDYSIIINNETVLIEGKEDNYSYTINEKYTIKENIKLAIYNFFAQKTGSIHPWGTLIGIRPTKIAARLIKNNYQLTDIINYYNEHYQTSEEKAKLCYEVAKNQEEYLYNDKRNISVYIGMPFCPTRCAYCSFAANGIRGKEQLVEAYIEALNKEIKALSEYIRENNLTIESVYFGGGTPTSVNNVQFSNVMESIYNAFVKGFEVKEFTVEAGRPDSITEEKLRTMKQYKVTRISINPQSMNDKTLKAIGRIHTVNNIKEKYNLARSLGFDNINMDIIVGLPGEGLEEIEMTCKEIAKLKPESLTVHGMSIKRASKLHEALVNNQYSSNLSIEELNKMFSYTRKTAEELGMIPYYLYRQKNMVGNMENIGYTKRGLECIYNIKIMEENQSIIALGADASTKVVFPEENRIERFANLKDIGEYVKRIDELIEGKIALLDTAFKI